MAGKGSNPRPVDATKYRENWDRIFAKLRDADRQQREATDELRDLMLNEGPHVIDEHGHQDLT